MTRLARYCIAMALACGLAVAVFAMHALPSTEHGAHDTMGSAAAVVGSSSPHAGNMSSDCSGLSHGCYYAPRDDHKKVIALAALAVTVLATAYLFLVTLVGRRRPGDEVNLGPPTLSKLCVLRI